MYLFKVYIMRGIYTYTYSLETSDKLEMCNGNKYDNEMTNVILSYQTKN